MENYNVIGDIAGNYLTLKALLAKMPSDATPLSLGDMNDRGPRSKEVIEFFMNNGKAVNSNHGHLMVEAWEQSAMPGAVPRYYDQGIWFYNGAIQTLSSYDSDWSKKIDLDMSRASINIVDYNDSILHTLIPKEHIDFLKSLPMYIETDNFFLSHAPLHIQLNPKDANDIGNGFTTFGSDYKSEHSLLWNRITSERPNPYIKNKINIFGHNASNEIKVYTPQYTNGIKLTIEEWNDFKDIKKFNSQPPYQIGIDTSSVKKLTGIHLPTMTVYQQDYID